MRIFERDLLTLASAVTVCMAIISTASGDVRVSGPILTWHDDPTSTMTITWIERTIPSPPVANTWSQGIDGFGYGVQALRTPLPNMQGNYTMLAMRKSFNRDNWPEDATLTLQAFYDDGFIAWINGKEVVRASIKEGQGETATGISLHEATGLESFPIENWQELIKEGENIIAIEGHNADVNSSDFIMLFTLVLETETESTFIFPTYSQWQFFPKSIPEDGWQNHLADLPPLEIDLDTPFAENISALKYKTLADDEWLNAILNTRAFADTGNIVRSTTLRGLAPDTKYEFTLPVECIALLDNDQSSGGAFITAPQTDEKPIVFVAGGDMYHRLDWLNEMNRRAARENPLFALIGGDLAYADGRNPWRWYELIESWNKTAITPEGRMIPLVVAIGNHEVGWDKTPDEVLADKDFPLAKFFFSLFTLPQGKTNYVVDFNDYMSIVLLDSYHAQTVSSQTAWLDDALSKRTNQKHIFACYHKPAYGTNVKPDYTEIQQQWVPLFEKYGVDTAFENDHHIYKRTLPLYEGKVDYNKGVLYLGDGAWGVYLRPIVDYSDKEYIAKAISVRHFIRVELRDGRQYYTAVQANGKVIDKYPENWDE